jgi:hypothetical protein
VKIDVPGQPGNMARVFANWKACARARPSMPLWTIASALVEGMLKGVSRQ